jgi:hypothetical protein
MHHHQMDQDLVQDYQEDLEEVEQIKDLMVV